MYTYRRQNYFIEHLNNILEYKIPDDIVNSIQVELKHTRSQPIDADQIYMILKRLGKSKYYEYSEKILRIIQGKPTSIPISDDQQNMMIKQFSVVNGSFKDACKNLEINRNGFFNYNYCIHKIAQLLGIPDINNFLKLPRSALPRSVKLQEYYNKIWGEIARINKWPENITLIELERMNKCFVHTIYCLNKWLNNQNYNLPQDWVCKLEKFYFDDVIYY